MNQMEVQQNEDDQLYHTPPPCLAFLDLLSDERRQEYLNYGIPMYQAALKGEWEAARQIHHMYPESIIARITKQGDTALHIAAAARHTYFVVGLVALMTKNSSQTLLLHNLASQNNAGNTALCLAAASGTVPIAKVMVQSYPGGGLPLIRGNAGLTPLHMAALLGHKEMVNYLLPLTRPDLTTEELVALLISTINTDLYDVALDILASKEELAITRDENEETPLHVLARKSGKSCRSQLGIWKQCYNIFIKNNKFGIRKESSLQPLALKLVERLWGIVISQTEANVSDLMARPQRLLFVAVEAGNFEFLITLIQSYPDLIWKLDDNFRSIFHVAVQHRHEKIFRLIYEIGAIKDLLATYTDDKDNSMLHYAAMLPSSDKLNRISGAALQMQREMLWFKVVEDLMHPQLAEAKNEDKETPQALFTEQHEKLRKEGEEWMRKTASSCSVVATLIASVVFGAALKAPGVGHGVWHWVFVASDSLSLISSTASILTFLSILTSSYAEEDFLQSLPLKLMIGLILLFVSIATMMIAFTATFSIIYNHGLLWIGTSVLACVPIVLFGLQIFPLLMEVYRSTIGSISIFKPRHQLFR